MIIWYRIQIKKNIVILKNNNAEKYEDESFSIAKTGSVTDA